MYILHKFKKHGYVYRYARALYNPRSPRALEALGHLSRQGKISAHSDCALFCLDPMDRMLGVELCRGSELFSLRSWSKSELHTISFKTNRTCGKSWPQEVAFPITVNGMARASIWKPEDWSTQKDSVTEIQPPDRVCKWDENKIENIEWVIVPNSHEVGFQSLGLGLVQHFTAKIRNTQRWNRGACGARAPKFWNLSTCGTCAFFEHKEAVEPCWTSAILEPNELVEPVPFLNPRNP